MIEISPFISGLVLPLKTLLRVAVSQHLSLREYLKSESILRVWPCCFNTAGKSTSALCFWQQLSRANTNALSYIGKIEVAITQRSVSCLERLEEGLYCGWSGSIASLIITDECCFIMQIRQRQDVLKKNSSMTLAMALRRVVGQRGIDFLERKIGW